MNTISSGYTYTSLRRHAHLGWSAHRDYFLADYFTVSISGYIGNNVYEFGCILIDGTIINGKASKVRHLHIIKRAIERYNAMWSSGLDRAALRRQCFYWAYAVDEDDDTIITLNVQLFIVREFWARHGETYA
jgi:hypothetical protein